VTGWYITDTFPFLHGFFRDKKGVFTTLDVPHSDLTEAVGLNDRGQVVGDYRDASTGVFHGFVWDAGVFSTIDVPFAGATSTAAQGINRFGAIVGFYDDASGRHGFLFKNGEFTSIVFPGSSVTTLEDINDKGQIVGLYVDGNATLHSFMLDDGVFNTIDVPFTSVFTGVSGINDFGEFVGRYFDGDKSHGFIATRTGGPLMFCS
jgi:probable HAF family extracellular repeat protein